MKALIIVLLALSGCATTQLQTPEERNCWQSCYDKYGKKLDHSLGNLLLHHNV